MRVVLTWSTRSCSERISSVWSFAALGRPAEAGCDARDVAELRRSGLLDVAHYLALGPDPGGAPHLHYLREGWRQGRQPNANQVFNWRRRVLARSPLPTS